MLKFTEVEILEMRQAISLRIATLEKSLFDLGHSPSFHSIKDDVFASLDVFDNILKKLDEAQK